MIIHVVRTFAILPPWLFNLVCAHLYLWEDFSFPKNGDSGYSSVKLIVSIWLGIRRLAKMLKSQQGVGGRLDSAKTATRDKAHRMSGRDGTRDKLEDSFTRHLGSNLTRNDMRDVGTISRSDRSKSTHRSRRKNIDGSQIGGQIPLHILEYLHALLYAKCSQVFKDVSQKESSSYRT